MSLHSAKNKLNKIAPAKPPGRPYILWPGDEPPPDIEAGDIIIRVVYVDSRQSNKNV